MSVEGWPALSRTPSLVAMDNARQSARITRRRLDTWNEIVAADPEYAPARQNLVILQQVQHGDTHGSGNLGSGLAHEP